MRRLTTEREAELRAKPAHFHVHELWPEIEALRAELAIANACIDAVEAVGLRLEEDEIEADDAFSQLGSTMQAYYKSLHEAGKL